MNRPKPAHPDQLGDAARVLTVGLHGHRRERRFHVPGLQKNGFKTGRAQSGMQPLRQRSGFKPNPRYRKVKILDKRHECIRVARDLGLLHNLPFRIHNTDAREFQRHVDPSIMIHGCPPSCDAWGLAPNQDPVSPSYGGQPPLRPAQGRAITASSATVIKPASYGFNFGIGSTDPLTPWFWLDRPTKLTPPSSSGCSISLFKSSLLP